MEPDRRRRLGRYEVFPIGFGAARVSIEGRPPRHIAVEAVARAIESGATMIDTADAYCVDSALEHGYGERVVRDAVKRTGRSASDVLVATKGGEVRPGDGSWRLAGRPEDLRSACETSLEALGVEAIDLYQLHRPDPTVPLEESLGAMTELRAAGLVREIGVCNVSASEAALALSVAPIVSIQNPLWYGSRGQDDVISLCEAQGVAFVAHSPFGGPGGSRRMSRSGPLGEVALRHRTAVHAIALAWLLDRSATIIPIPGSSDPDRAALNLEAARIRLSEEDRRRLGGAGAS